MPKKMKKMDKLLVWSGDSHIERVRSCLASLSILTVRIVFLEYSQLRKKDYNLVVREFGGFDNVLLDVGVCAILHPFIML